MSNWNLLSNSDVFDLIRSGQQFNSVCGVLILQTIGPILFAKRGAVSRQLNHLRRDHDLLLFLSTAFGRAKKKTLKSVINAHNSE